MCTGLCRIIREADEQQYARMRQWALNIVDEPEDPERSPPSSPSPVVATEVVPPHFAFSFRCQARPQLRPEAPSFVPSPAHFVGVEEGDTSDYELAVEPIGNVFYAWTVLNTEDGADRRWTVQHIEHAGDWTIEDDTSTASDSGYDDDDSDDDDDNYDKESRQDWDTEDLGEDGEASLQEEQDQNQPGAQEGGAEDADDEYSTDSQSAGVSDVRNSSSGCSRGNLNENDTYRGYHWRLVKPFLFIPDVTADDIVNAYMALRIDNNRGRYYSMTWPLETRVLLMLKKHRSSALW